MLSPADQGGNNAIDSDANTTTGKTSTVTLTAGQNDSTLDIAYNDPRGSIGDHRFGPTLIAMAFKTPMSPASLA